MKFHAQKFSLAATLTMGIVYVVCAAFTAVAPDLALKFLGWMLHIVNVEKFAGEVQMTFGSVILGLLPILFYTYLATWLFAWLYNKFLASAPHAEQ